MHVEIYFDFSCPFAFLASTQIEALCARAGAGVVWRPMLLGGVFRGAGQPDEPMRAMNPAKSRHNLLDVHRAAERWGVPLTMPAGHPMRTVRALRALLAVPEPRWPPVIHALYRSYWQRGRDDFDSAETVAAALAEAGLDQAAIAAALAANDDPAIKDELRRRTDEAVARGVFGAPAMFVHVDDLERPEMFWGQDRLHMVEAMLAGWRPGRTPPPAPAAAPALAAAHAPGPRTLHFWYDFSSPFSYLAATQVEAACGRAGARLVWEPMLLGALFKEVGTPNVPLLAMPESKRAYMYRDLDHWAAYFGVPFRFASRFPMRTVTALRLALLAGDRRVELSHALFRALWVEDRDLDDAATLAEILRRHGFDPESMLARTQEPEIKQALVNQTTRAAQAGVFGAPTMIVTHERGDLLFWGQDRLILAEAAAAGWRPQAG
jgi:2-hydroxychromene-2-carboxylate isomerase